jgi:hypothetical protein
MQIPSKASFTGNGVTEAGFKARLEELHDFLTGMLGGEGTRAFSARNSNTQLGVADNRKTIGATGTFTQTFAAAAALGAGWECWYMNSGSGVITLDPNGAETIDGAATLAMHPGDARRIICDGSAFRTLGLPYAVGDFTPVFSTSAGGVTYALQSGDYVKIGKVVHWSLSLALSNKGSGTFNGITGFPFITNGVAQYAAARFQNMTTNITNMVLELNGNAFFPYIVSAAAASMTAAAMADFSNTTWIRATGTAFV